MKKIILVLSFTIFVMSCNSKPDKNDEELKAQAIATCEKEAIDPTMSEGHKSLLKDYCSCSVDKMLGEFTYTEMLKMNKPSKELEDRLMTLIQPCVDDLQKKLLVLEEVKY